MYKLLSFIFLLSLSFFAFGQNQDKKPTLYDLQQKYVGKEVIIKSKHYSEDGQQTAWEKAIKKGIYYVGKRYLPNNYLKQKATIIAIQPYWPADREKLGKTDLFGNEIGPESIIDPYFNVIVKFKDGKFAIASSYSGITNSIFETKNDYSEYEKLKQNINKLILPIIGDTLFATRTSSLYKVTAKVSDLFSEKGKAIDFPRLEPLIIVTAKYYEVNSDQTFTLASDRLVLIKLKDRNNHFYLSYCDAKKIKYYYNYSVLQIIAHNTGMYIKIPDYLTNEEIQAIRDGTFFKGMSVYALYEAIGLPDKENKDSYGGNQLIYFDHTLYIYLDKENEHVESWQRIE